MREEASDLGARRHLGNGSDNAAESIQVLMAREPRHRPLFSPCTRHLRPRDWLRVSIRSAEIPSPPPVIEITACRHLSDDAIVCDSAYTMSMGRKGAMILLAIVALWVVAPAIVCLAPAPCHQCCRAMMVDCDSAMLLSHPCCQLRNSNPAILPDRATVTDFSSGATQALASISLPDLSVLTGQSTGPSKAPPPRSLSGASSILRI